MHSESRDVPTDAAELLLNDLDAFTSYEDDGDLVICAKENPGAWVKSDVTELLTR